MNSILASIDIPLWFALIPLAIILLYGVSLRGKGEWHDDSLSLAHSKDILGFFALLIVVHHTVQNIIWTRNIDVGIMGVFENIGVCFVGVFFFFSGYGLITSLRKKDNYLEGFFRKRILKIIIPFYFVNTFFFIILYIRGMIEKDETVLRLLGILMPNDHMWYLVEIVLLYTLFYLNFKRSKTEEKAFIKMFVEIIIIIIASLLLGHGSFWFQGEWWYNTTILFFIGMIAARFEKPLVSFVRRNYSCLLPMITVLFLGLYMITMQILYAGGYYTEYDRRVSKIGAYVDKYQMLVVQSSMVICFVLLVLLIGQKIQVKNKVLRFLGEISLELYITHRLCIWDLEIIKSAGIYLVAVLACAVALGWIFHLILRGGFKLLWKIRT